MPVFAAMGHGETRRIVEPVAGAMHHFGDLGQRADGPCAHVRDQRTGAARIAAVPERVARHFSKRSQEAEVSAKRYGEEQGLNWEELSGERKSALMKAGAEALRQRKDRDHDAPSDFSRWKDEAAEIGYQHRSVLRPDETPPELSPDRRIDLAYRVTANDLAEARRSSLPPIPLCEARSHGR
jgi:hypothetical protein